MIVIVAVNCQTNALARCLAKTYTFWKAPHPRTGSFVSMTPHNAVAGRFWKGYKLTSGLGWT